MDQWFFAPIINEMVDRQDRMSQEHPGASETHDYPDILFHGWLVTVNRAILTGGFCLLKGTVIQPVQGILLKRGANITICHLLMVMVFAVETHHGLNGFAFPVHSI